MTEMVAAGRGVDERAAIEACVDDYFGGWFAADAERMRRAVHPELVKRGYLATAGSGPGLDRNTSDSMVEFTAMGGGSRRPSREQAFTVNIVDVYEDIASVTVTSPVYHEYLQLVRTPTGWQIVHSLWRPTR